MERKPIKLNIDSVPQKLIRYIDGATVYDSSCSTEARVLFIDKDDGYFLKSSQNGALQREAELDGFFHTRGQGPEVVEYISLDEDWLLTKRVKGEDLTHTDFLSKPTWLCDTLAEILRKLHESDPGDCPVKNRTGDYLSTANANYEKGMFDPTYLLPTLCIKSADEARRIIELNAQALKCDTLLHGDYCLPNIIIDNNQLSGFIDLGAAGIGDRHIDLFWGAWTLNYNLGTDKYRDRFFDAYGRDKIDTGIIELISIIETFG